MSLDYSYRHLYYFWVVAKEGGMARAAARLGMAVQTVSAQVRELERALGQQLLKPAGRGLALTDAGHAALRQADQIFALGEQLPGLVRDAVASPQVRLAVGISDGLSKLVVRRLLQPVMDTPRLRLLCHEDEFDRLLAVFCHHDLVIAFSQQRCRHQLVDRVVFHQQYSQRPLYPCGLLGGRPAKQGRIGRHTRQLHRETEGAALRG